MSNPGGQRSSRPVVLLFGAGKLSLGLLAPLHNPDQIDLHMVGRRNGNSSAIAHKLAADRSYVLEVRGEEPRQVTIAGFHYSDTPDGLKEVTELLRSERTLVVLVCAGEGQRDVIDLIRDALACDLPPVLPDLLVVPCENVVSPDFQKLAADSESFCRLISVGKSMVDRACSEPPQIIDGRVVIATEAFYEWAVELGSSIGTTPFASAHGQIIQWIGADLTGSVAPVRERKALLMNGVESTLAALALADWIQEEKPITLSDYVAVDYGGRNLDGLIADFSAILAIRLAAMGMAESVGRIDEEAAHYRTRIKENPKETATRIFRRVLEYRIDEHWDDWQYKVLQPMATYRRYCGSNPPFIEDAIEAMFDLIEWYRNQQGKGRRL
ncbi:MAG TPA: hypothetical protein VHB02_04900 [Acidimicrobiales bacterium]|nr:hypothetical protein [Acidimicrobiales bacterium]